jgi:hypothetical protein
MVTSEGIGIRADSRVIRTKTAKYPYEKIKDVNI